MGYYAKVLRGNVDAALKQITRQQNADNVRKLMKNAQYYRKPSELRRQKRNETVRRHQTADLFSNLRMVFERKGRGF